MEFFDQMSDHGAAAVALRCSGKGRALPGGACSLCNHVAQSGNFLCTAKGFGVFPEHVDQLVHQFGKGADGLRAKVDQAFGG